MGIFLETKKTLISIPAPLDLSKVEIDANDLAEIVGVNLQSILTGSDDLVEKKKLAEEALESAQKALEIAKNSEWDEDVAFEAAESAYKAYKAVLFMHALGNTMSPIGAYIESAGLNIEEDELGIDAVQKEISDALENIRALEILVVVTEPEVDITANVDEFETEEPELEIGASARAEAKERADYDTVIKNFRDVTKVKVKQTVKSLVKDLSDADLEMFVENLTKKITNSLIQSTTDSLNFNDPDFKPSDLLKASLDAVTGKVIENGVTEKFTRLYMADRLEKIYEKVLSENKVAAEQADIDKSLAVFDARHAVEGLLEGEEDLDLNSIDALIEPLIRESIESSIEESQRMDAEVADLDKALNNRVKDFSFKTDKTKNATVLRMHLYGVDIPEESLSEDMRAEIVRRSAVTIGVMNKLEATIKKHYPNTKIDEAKIQYLAAIADKITTDVELQGASIATLLMQDDPNFNVFIEDVVLDINGKDNTDYLAANRYPEGYLDAKIIKFVGEAQTRIDGAPTTTVREGGEVEAIPKTMVLFDEISSMADQVSAEKKFLFFARRVLQKTRQKLLVDVFVSAGGMEVDDKFESMGLAVFALAIKCKLDSGLIQSKEFVEFVKTAMKGGQIEEDLRGLISATPERIIQNRKEYLKVMSVSAEVVAKSTKSEDMDRTYSLNRVNKVLHDYGYIKKNIFGVVKAHYNNLHEYGEIIAIAAANPRLFDEIEKHCDNDVAKLNKVCKAMVAAIGEDNVHTLADINVNEMLEGEDRELLSKMIIGSDVQDIISAATPEAAKRLAEKFVSGEKETSSKQHLFSVIKGSLGVTDAQVTGLVSALSKVDVGDGEVSYLSEASVMSVMEKVGIEVDGEKVADHTIGSQFEAHPDVLKKLLKKAQTEHGVEVTFETDSPQR